jgi:hypothetical protein
VSGAARGEERRLRRIFQRALWLAVAAPLSCATEEPPPPTTAGAGGAEQEPEAPGGGGAEQEPGAPGGVDVSLPPSADRAAAGACAAVPYTPNPPDKCGKYVRLPCGLPAGLTPGGNCYLWLNDCEKFCPGAYFNCHAVGDSCQNGTIVKDATGGVDLDCATCAKGVGRIPAGLAPARMKRAPSAVGDYLAGAAHLEAAAVHAFRRLQRELAGSGAPARLLRAARRAAADEVRHARVTARLARRFGGTFVRPRVAAVAARPLAAVAAENAVEGCVRETFGALVASFQAAHAEDPEIARAMATIARDETRHAALSWAVARWAAGRLDPAARAGLAAQCREAARALRREADAPVPEELQRAAGLPGSAQQHALLGVLETQLWAAWVATRAARGAGEAAGAA